MADVSAPPHVGGATVGGATVDGATVDGAACI